jgi:hypothetical protein
MTHTQNTQKTIENFLSNLNTEVDILGYINIEDIDHSDPYNSIYEMIQENGGFNIDIIYYSDAINYLKEHDQSLSDSLEIAIEYGYTIENINSELLASLLASRNAEENFYQLQSEIEDFFSDFYLKAFKEEFDNINLEKMYEIEVIDNRTNKEDYLIFDIELIEDKLIATHQPTTHEEEKSNKIATVEIILDKFFSLDEHLQELYDECINKIINSDFYTLNN